MPAMAARAAARASVGKPTTARAGVEAANARTFPTDHSVGADQEHPRAKALRGFGGRRFPGFDDKIVSMYVRGMSTREIVGHQPGGAKASSQSAALLAWLAARTMARLSSRNTSAHDPM
jgi:hypothetical protein